MMVVAVIEVATWSIDNKNIFNDNNNNEDISNYDNNKMMIMKTIIIGRGKHYKQPRFIKK